MDNEPNKKDAKGKRIFKKAIRRKSNNSQNSNAEPEVGVSRSKSFQSKNGSGEINESIPLPKPDGTVEKVITASQVELDERSGAQSRRNSNGEGASKALKIKSPSVRIKESLDETNTRKNSLKRKLEEESAAGTSGASAATSDNDADDKDSKDKKKKNRCAVCRKKVGLTGFECRCGGLFCAVHRYSDKHECSFDYRELGAQEIRRNNPVVVSQKIHKI